MNTAQPIRSEQELKDYENTIDISDGQHRIFAFSDIFELYSLLICASIYYISYHERLFVYNIHHEQTFVNTKNEHIFGIYVCLLYAIVI